MSDASVGDQVSTFVGLGNFRAAWEMDTFRDALRNSIVFLVVAAIFKSLLGTSLAFLLLQNFKGKKLVRALVVIPFTLPITVSVLSWKWMYDSQFSVINWGLHKAGLIGGYGSESWPIWLGQPHLALLACIGVNVWRSFPFSAIVLLAGFTSVPTEVLDAARVDGCSFFQRFRHIVTPMIFPILIIGFLFDTVFTLSDLSVVYVLTQGGPGSATHDPADARLPDRHPGGQPRPGLGDRAHAGAAALPRALPDAPEPEAEGLVRTAAAPARIVRKRSGATCFSTRA